MSNDAGDNAPLVRRHPIILLGVPVVLGLAYMADWATTNRMFFLGCTATVFAFFTTCVVIASVMPSRKDEED